MERGKFITLLGGTAATFVRDARQAVVNKKPPLGMLATFGNGCRSKQMTIGSKLRRLHYEQPHRGRPLHP